MDKILPTSVVGSYSVPEWLERIKTDYHQRRISGGYLDEIHDAVVKAALKDQEVAGIDVVSDGELRRDNMIDYFTTRLPGVEIEHRAKAYYYDLYDSVVRHPIPPGRLHLESEFLFTRQYTDRPIKYSVTGPFSLMKRIRNEGAYAEEQALARDIARALNGELRALVQAGATFIQIDEPYYSGFPEAIGWGVDVLNALVEGVDAHLALHICYGNRYGKPFWAGTYEYLFPTILEARVHQLVLECARKGFDDLALFRRYPNTFELELGVIDVKDPQVETPRQVADRIREGLQYVPAERVYVNPDCGLRHLPLATAQGKLAALVQGTNLVRQELLGRSAAA